MAVDNLLVTEAEQLWEKVLEFAYFNKVIIIWRFPSKFLRKILRIT